ncbi:MAG: hypothetical protein Kow0062_24570 [Acidobacteriota bacterium]
MDPSDTRARLARLAILALALTVLSGLGVLEARSVRGGAPPRVAAVAPVPAPVASAQASVPQRARLPVRVERLEVRRGDTLAALLRGRGLSGEQVAAVVQALAPVHPPRRLRPGDELTLEFADGPADRGAHALVRVVLRPDVRREIVVRPAGDGRFAASVEQRPLARVIRRADGEIEDSLFASARRAGIPAPVIAAVIREFSYQVDFQRDLRRGDRFDVLWEALVDEDGREVGAEPFLHALLTTAGTPREIYRFDDPAGERTGYYEPDGRSARKTLMRTPIDGARLTSGFGMRRHPILGYTRRHTGVDFGAPAGTPVWAAGDGVVVEAGWKGGYGRWVRIRHGGGFETGYAHLSRIARGIRPGVRVRQGQVIGRVGATGLANAPHLHYEVFRAGRRVNPRTVELPTAEALAGGAMTAFASQRDRVRALLEPPGGSHETVARGGAPGTADLQVKH